MIPPTVRTELFAFIKAKTIVQVEFPPLTTERVKVPGTFRVHSLQKPS